jgi:hypothetical protein
VSGSASNTPSPNPSSGGPCSVTSDAANTSTTPLRPSPDWSPTDPPTANNYQPDHPGQHAPTSIAHNVVKSSQYTVQMPQGGDQLNAAETAITKGGARVLIVDARYSGDGARIESFAKAHRVPGGGAAEHPGWLSVRHRVQAGLPGGPGRRGPGPVSPGRGHAAGRPSQLAPHGSADQQVCALRAADTRMGDHGEHELHGHRGQVRGGFRAVHPRVRRGLLRRRHLRWLRAGSRGPLGPAGRHPKGWGVKRQGGRVCGGVWPGGCLGVVSAGFQAAVQDADEAVAELAEGSVVARAAGTLPVVAGAGSW